MPFHSRGETGRKATLLKKIAIHWLWTGEETTTKDCDRRLRPLRRETVGDLQRYYSAIWEADNPKKRKAEKEAKS